MNKNQIEIINSIPSYYNVKLFLYGNIDNIDDPKWSIHVLNFTKEEWSSEIYNVIDEYKHPKYGNITVLIKKHMNHILMRNQLLNNNINKKLIFININRLELNQYIINQYGI